MSESETDILDRVADWPAEAQAELRQIANEIEAHLDRGMYIPTPAELEGIDRGIASAERGELVGMDEIEKIFDKHLRK